MHNQSKPEQDSREWQAMRVANFLEASPNSTAKEVDAACDVGCITKVFSDMPKLGYGVGKAWRTERCDQGNRTRKVRTYILLYRPENLPDLFSDT